MEKLTEDPDKKNQAPSSDVLKKLKEVRKKLQESLSEGEEKAAVKTPQGTQGIIPGATETLARATAEKERAKLQKEMAAAEKLAAPTSEPGAPQRQLYKAGGAETSEITAMKAKGQAKPTLTAARLASIQRRVRQKATAARTMGKGKRIALVIVLVFAFLPLIGSLQVGLLACEFKFSEFGINRDRNSPGGEISISLPIHNPQFLPAFLGQVSLKILDPTTDKEVLRAATVSTHVIAPYDTITLTLEATLNPDYAGEWITGLLDTRMLNIKIVDLSYGGLTVPNDIIPAISLDLSGLINDLLGGLDIGEMVGGLLGDLQEAESQTTSDHIVRNLWAEAKATSIVNKIVEENIESPSEAQFEDLLGSFSLNYLDVYETTDRFVLELAVGLTLPSLPGINLGPIVMSYMNASIYTNTVDGVGVKNITHKENYQWEIARLELVPSTTVGDKNTGKNIDGIDDAAYICLDGIETSYLSARMTIFKDVCGALHPSATLDWDDPTAVTNFAKEAKKDYPTWYFLYNLLANGSLDIYLNIHEVDIELFGISIKDLALDIIPPVYIDGLLNINELLSPMGVGFGDGLAMFLVGTTTGGLALPTYLNNRYEIGPDARVHTAYLTSENLTDAIMGMINMDAIGLDLGAIQESFGPTANLSLGISLPINNTIFNIHAGLQDLEIRLGSKLPNEAKDADPTFFAMLGLTSNNGSKTIYLNGSTPPYCATTIDAKLTILKNETYAPYVAQFLRTFIEQWTLDAAINVKLGKLILFDHNLTMIGIDITISLKIDLSDLIGDLIGGLVGGLVGDLTGSLLGGEETSGESVQQALSNPLSAVYALPFVLTSPVAAVALGQPRSAQFDDLLGDMAISFSVSSNPIYTEIGIGISGLSLNLKEMGIPITLGLGYSTFTIQGAVPNLYGGFDWTDMLTLKIENYLDLGSNDPQSLIASIKIYEAAFSGGAICNFLGDFLGNGSITMKLSGNTALNLSGIFLEDLDLSLALEKVETGLNVTALIDGLVGSIGGSSSDPPIDWGPVPAWWTGEASSLPFLQPLMAQEDEEESSGIDLNAFLSINTDDLQIFEITEHSWPYQNDTVRISIGLPITNKMMTLMIPQLEVALYADAANTQLIAAVELDPASGILRTNQEAMLVINVDLVKSPTLETWINDILRTFTLSAAYISLNLSIGVFGCTIGPISINNLSLGSLGLGIDTITGLLEAVNPMNEELGNPLAVLGNEPNAAQLDIMSLIGKFGLAWIDIAPARWDGAKWDKDEEYPMMNISIGLALQPAFNISISGADTDPNTSDLQLCDSTIFKAIYDLPKGTPKDVTLWNTAVKHSKVADLFFRNTPVYFNNSYYGSAGQATNTAIDPHKPYFLNNSADLTRAATCQTSYDETKATGTYTWDDGTDSEAAATGRNRIEVVSSPIGYRTEAIGSQALRITSGGNTGLIPLKASFNITTFWSITFMARSASAGDAYLYFNTGEASLHFYTTSEWQKYTFTFQNFTISSWDWMATQMYFRAYSGGYLYIDDLSITAPEVSAYTSWGDAGALDNDPAMVKDSTFNFLEINLLMYNISHPSFAQAYPRALWRKLGGAYFSPIVYGKAYGGYPDHRVVYHPYFSPYANFFTNVVALLGGVLGGGDMGTVIADLLGAIAFNGSLTLNVFSTAITLDVGLPILSDLMDSIGTLLAVSMYRVLDKVTNPLSDGTPFPALFEDLLGGLGNINIVGLFIEMPIFGGTERNNHAFCPQYVPSTGSNINPWEYYRDQYDYIPGLATAENPNGMNEENFYKDTYYNDFKMYCENYANSLGIDNPYFESKHPLSLVRNDPASHGGTYLTDEYGSTIFDLRDPDSWALKYSGNRYGGTGRTRTMVLDFILGLSIPLGVEILGAYIYFLFDSPNVPCGYTPGGYIFLNESQYLPQGPGWKAGDGSDIISNRYAWTTKTSYPGALHYDEETGAYIKECGRDPRFSLYPAYNLTSPVKYNDNGKIIGSWRQDGTFQEGSIGNWLMMNIRLFEGAATYSFLDYMVASVLSVLSGFASVASANASLFGYEVYNIGGLGLSLGPHSPGANAECYKYTTGAGNGTSWNMPATNGTVLPPEAEQPLWPPMLPGFTPIAYNEDSLYLSMGDLFGTLLDDILTWIMDHISIDIGDILTLLVTGTIHITIEELVVNNPIPLPMWIKSIVIELSITLNDYAIDIGAYDTGDLWVEFDTYDGQRNDPYYFDVNPLTNISVYEPVTLPNIDLYVKLPNDILGMIVSLLTDGLNIGFELDNIILYLALPAEWDWVFPLDAVGMLGDIVDLGSLLG